MNKHSGVDVCDAYDTRCGSRWDYGLNAALAEEFGAFPAFRARAFDDIGSGEVIVLACGASGLRGRRRYERRTCGAKRKLASVGDVRLAWCGVIGSSGVAVGRHRHHVREGDAWGLRQDGN